MCDRICVVWPRVRMSLVRGCPRFFSFERVEGGRTSTFGVSRLEGVEGGRVGERKDSRHAIRGWARGAGALMFGLSKAWYG